MGETRISTSLSQDLYIGSCLPTKFTSLAHAEGIPNTPILVAFVDTILNSHIRAPLTAAGTGNAFLETAPQIPLSDRMTGVERSSHRFPSSANETDHQCARLDRIWVRIAHLHSKQALVAVIDTGGGERGSSLGHGRTSIPG